MTSVGVRELRQRASELLRLVEGGETIEITDRGRPVALLAPLPEGSPLERLRAAGESEPAEGDLDAFPRRCTRVPPSYRRRSWLTCAGTSGDAGDVPGLVRSREARDRGA